jgi:2-polyprenyl-3-methyl-5-hydroxy-6-metoxy-1,4-benzoquinol methylase
MKRATSKELLDCFEFPDPIVTSAYADLARIHRWLGDTACVVRALRRNSQPVQRVLDIGCARGGLISEIQDALQTEVIGIDLRDHAGCSRTVPMVVADATRDPLPEADVAFAMHFTHHLSEAEVIELIANVSRFCRRFVIIDLVRHWLPLFLFRSFVAPFVGQIAAADGATSVRRAYRPEEMAAMVRRALAGTTATFTHRVSPFYVRQVVDISFR